METTESQESLSMLHRKNGKCRAFFDYFGRLRPTSVNCTNCGKRCQYGVADFARHTGHLQPSRSCQTVIVRRTGRFTSTSLVPEPRR
jgi:hypothetical protein